MVIYPVSEKKLNTEFLKNIESGQISEDVTIEFKSQAYNLSLRDTKKDFLRDIVAMINSKGGVIFLGVSDDGEVLGVEIDNLDLYKRQIQQVINTGVEPQVTGIDFKPIENDGKLVLCILVPTLKNKPYSHKVAQSQYREFLIRNNGINHHLSMSEIRRLFLGQESSSTQSWDDWRNAILTNVKENTWLKELETPKCLLTFVTPVDTNPKDNLIDTEKIKKLSAGNMYIWPPHSNGCTHIPFEKGIFALGRPKGDFGRDEKCYSFVVAENNSAIYFYDGMPPFSRDDSKQIHSSIDELLLKYVEKASLFLEVAGLTGHLYEINFFILNCKGYKVARDHFFFAFPGAVGNSTGIPSDIFELTVRFEVGDDLVRTIKPVLDKLWQTSGFDRSLNYDENGSFLGRS